MAQTQEIEKVQADLWLLRRRGYYRLTFQCCLFLVFFRLKFKRPLLIV